MVPFSGSAFRFIKQQHHISFVDTPHILIIFLLMLAEVAEYTVALFCHNGYNVQRVLYQQSLML